MELHENGGSGDSVVVGDGNNEDEEVGCTLRAYAESKEGGLVDLGRSSWETFGEKLSESVFG